MADLLTDTADTKTDTAAATAATASTDVKTTTTETTTTAEKTWLDTLPDDLKQSPQLLKFKESGIEGVARSYVNIERMLGNDKVPIPKDPNDTEGWERYHKAGGRPDDPTKYEFQKPEKLPEGVTYDEGMETWWRQSAHEAGLSQRQAGKLFEKYRDRFLAQIDLGNKSADGEVEKAKLELQRDWGGEFEARRTLAKAAFNEMPKDLQEVAVRSGMARMPSFLKYLHDIKAKTTGEVDPKLGAAAQGDSPDAIKSKIADHREKHAAALMDVTHPEHGLRAAELQALYTKLYPVEAA